MSASKSKAFDVFKVNNAVEVQELLKKANYYYQSDHIAVSIIYFNEVLDVEPENTTAQFFIKLKKEQYEKDINQSNTKSSRLNFFIINKEYEKAYRELSELLQQDVYNKNYIELHNVLHGIIEYKIKLKLLKKIGDLSVAYVKSNKKEILNDDEEKIYNQFTVPDTLKNILSNSTLNELKVLNTFHKLINKNYIQLYKSENTNQTAAKDAKEMMDIIDSLENKEKKPPQLQKPSYNLIKNDKLLNKTSSTEDYEQLYKTAMGLYVRRNYQESLKHFLKCKKMKPNDSKVLHNITKLEERLNQ